jgi:hypothetical protein
MEPSEAGAARPAAAPGDRLKELSASARGWHTIQMAVLGFIGICGVLRTADGSLVTGPTGAISVRTGSGVVTVPAQAVAQIRPVARCP